jgi:hypothetical protein
MSNFINLELSISRCAGANATMHSISIASLVGSRPAKCARSVNICRSSACSMRFGARFQHVWCARHFAVACRELIMDLVSFGLEEFQNVTEGKAVF